MSDKIREAQAMHLLNEISEAPNEVAIYACLDRIDVFLGKKDGVIEWPVAALAQQPTLAVPDNCRQRLMVEGKPYPKSSCAACGQFSPKSRECDAMLAAAPATPIQADHTALLSELYQILGAHDATEAVLDQVQAAIADEPLPHASLLPYEAPAAQEPAAWACTAHKQGVTEQRSLFHGEQGADVWLAHFASRGCEVTKAPLYTAPPAAEQPDTEKAPRNTRAVLAMILQALDRDSADGKAARGEMAAELRALLGKEGEA